jgi:hypothetical protein
MGTRQDNIDIILKERPYVAQVIQTQLLNDIAGILYEQLAVSKDAIADLLRKYQFNVTDTVLELNGDKLSSFPWISMAIFNDGADPVHIYINEWGMDVVTDLTGSIPSDPPLSAHDTFQIDLRSPRIKKVFLVCDRGKTATVRIFATMKEYTNHPREPLNLQV